MDHVLYRYEATLEEEAHYLAALLNAPCVDAAIKPYQTKGSFGQRHVHRRPFEVLPNPIPRFDPQDDRHRRLAELSKLCHERVAAMELPQTMRIGRLRQEMREALHEELAAIDALARELLQICQERASYGRRKWGARPLDSRPFLWHHDPCLGEAAELGSDWGQG